jgi:hypothetical protein
MVEISRNPIVIHRFWGNRGGGGGKKEVRWCRQIPNSAASTIKKHVLNGFYM